MLNTDTVKHELLGKRIITGFIAISAIAVIISMGLAFRDPPEVRQQIQHEAQESARQDEEAQKLAQQKTAAEAAKQDMQSLTDLHEHVVYFANEIDRAEEAFRKETGKDIRHNDLYAFYEHAKSFRSSIETLADQANAMKAPTFTNSKLTEFTKDVVPTVQKGLQNYQVATDVLMEGADTGTVRPSQMDSVKQARLSGQMALGEANAFIVGAYHQLGYTSDDLDYKHGGLTEKATARGPLENINNVKAN